MQCRARATLRRRVTITLQYGDSGLNVDLRHARVDVITPRQVEGLPDEAASFLHAVAQPMDGPPLRDTVSSGERVAIVIPDLTRAFPSERVLPWLLAELSHIAPKDLTILIGTGSHRAATADEIAGLVGADVAVSGRREVVRGDRGHRARGAYLGHSGEHR